MIESLRVDGERLLERLDALAQVGAIDGGGCCRLALTDADRLGRDLVVGWMREQGLAITVDAIGNVMGVRAGRRTGAPVMTGSHIDTVRTGGRYDGHYGVLAGLEVLRALDAAGLQTEHPLAVAFFTNEEGARFAPDMLGSLVVAGGLALDDALDVRAIDGARLGDELQRIGYAGTAAPAALRPRAFVELHIEQGHVLHAEGLRIGAVQDLQGISWQALTITGQSNHAGTTPMHLRRDAGLARSLGHTPRPMTSGAGHDAQMMARVGPSAMIFVPSVNGLSHNPAEHTEPADLVAGADVLLHTLLELAQMP